MRSATSDADIHFLQPPASRVVEAGLLGAAMVAKHCEAPGWRDAAAFFNAIRAARASTFQTFDDTPAKQPGLVRVLNGAGHGRELAALNTRGAGIYVSANPMRPGGRSLAHLIQIDTILADFDCGAPASIPIEPTLRVQTSICPDKGVVKEQWWWRLADGETLTADEQRGIMRCMIATYGSDPNAKDAARVGRLPGFWHRKADPQLVRIIGGTGRPVRKRDLIDAFPAPPEPERPTVPIQRILGTGNRYLEGTARRLQDEVASAPEGSRNACLNYAAFRLAQLGATDADVSAYLAPAAAAAGLHRTEISRTIASAITGAHRKSAP